MVMINRPGDFIPGIDCTTGKTVNHTAAEWHYLTRGLAIEHSYELGTTQARDKEGKLLYEIYSDRL
jgi:hypothetical protein